MFDPSLKLHTQQTWVDGFTLRALNESKDILQISPHEYSSYDQSESAPKEKVKSRSYIHRRSLHSEAKPRRRLPSDF